MPSLSRPKNLWEKVQTASCRTQDSDDEEDDYVECHSSPGTACGKDEDLYVRHGIYLSERIRFDGTIKCVVFNVTTSQFLFLYDDMRIVVRNANGERSCFSSTDLLEGMIFVPKTNRYVAWSTDGKLRVFDESLSLITTIPASSEVFCLIYNEFGDEVITGNRGVITVWIFRSGNTILIPKVSIRSDLTPDDKIMYISVEETSSKSQKCFAVVQNAIYIYRIKDGTCLEKLHNLHKTCLTGVMYFRPLKLLITSGQDGSIKTWNESYNLKTVFVGHTKSVNKIMLYKYGPVFLSISNDGSLRIWNLDTSDEVDVINVTSKLIGMEKYSSDDNFYTFTDSMLYIWKLNSVHSLVTAVGSRVKSIKSTTHPKIPMRALLICKDSCVRITCPKTGTVITVLVLPEEKVIQDAVHIISADLLFALLKDGAIIKSTTSCNPCKILETWDHRKTGAPSQCQQLCLYEYVVEDQMTGNRWQDLTIEARGRKYAEEKAEVMEDGSVKVADTYDRVILFGGCIDGTIVVYEWQHSKRSGSVTFVLQAHTEPVTAIASNPGNSQIISASTDMTIKIWRVFPFAQEALAPLFLYMSSEMPTHLAVSDRRLCVAFQERSVAAYYIGMYRTRNAQRARIEHKTDEEHNDAIVGISCCPKLRIFASASVDGTIRIWNESNKLIRAITLNAVPHSICFCTQRGDLLVSIGSHVHKISHQAYLPKAYMYQMAVMMFTDPPGEASIPVTEESMVSLTTDQKNRLLKAHSSLFKLSQFVDDLPEDEVKEREEEKSAKDDEYSVIAGRDAELRRLVSGRASKKKKSVVLRGAKKDAWNKYLNIFYNRETIKLPDEQKDKDEDSEFIKPVPQKYTMDRGDTGFFSLALTVSDVTKLRSSAQKQNKDIAYKETRSLSIAIDPEKENVDGKVFNETVGGRIQSAPSVRSCDRLDNADVDHTAAGMDNKENKLKIEIKGTLRGSSNTETLHEISKKLTDHMKKEKSYQKASSLGRLPVAPDGYLPNSVVVALYKELAKDKEPKTPNIDPAFRPKQLTAAQLAELTAFRKKKTPSIPEIEEDDQEMKPYKSKYLDMLETSISEGSIGDDYFLRTPSITPPESPSLTPEPSPVVEEIIEEPVKPRKEIVKYISKPVMKEEPEIKPKSPTPPPPPAPPPLPDFIVQFIGREWFFDFFKEKNTEEVWTVEAFVKKLLMFLKEVEDFQIKSDVCGAILLLNNQRKFNQELSKLVEFDLLEVLNSLSDSFSDIGYKAFLSPCLNVVLAVTDFNAKVVVELMTQHVLGGIDIRNLVAGIFEKNGLKDPYGYFVKQLGAFSTYSVPQSQRKDTLNEQCSNWLETWIDAFQKHIVSLAGKIYRARKGNVVRGTKSPDTPERIKGILKSKPNKDSPKKRRISFVPDNFVSDAAKNTTPIEAINYFCEVQREAELESMKEPEPEMKVTVEPKRSKDTVLLLPRLDGYASLARLGETHKSACHPERETGLSLDFRLPPIQRPTQDISVNSLSLHLKTLYLNPFPDALDDLMYDPYGQSSLVTLRTAKKYFIPSNSYVQELS